MSQTTDTPPAHRRAGLGCMGMSGMYGPADEAESIATIHAALDAGIRLLDTGDFYGMGHNELLISRAVEGRPRDSYQLSVKFGAQRAPDGSWLGYDASPPAVKTAAAYSLQRLRTDHIDVYRPARLDADIPIEETIGAIAELVQAGYVRSIGLSEVGADTIRRAAAVHPIADLQIEYSLLSRAIENEILPTCRELGIAITAYGVLSRGLLSDSFAPGSPAQPGDIRGRFPRFSDENAQHNAKLVNALREVARRKGATVAQLAIAWVASRGDDVIPLIGARRRAQLAEGLAGLELSLSDEDLEAIERAAPAGEVRGDRYGAPQMADLDSER
ncbi:MAG TPA: aldo/keto reductase [Solirubrobacteraceae bacterium]|nr:aldo/keto reductase [Solirubrobacteraceae bacterium]